MDIIPENTRVRIEPGRIGSPILMGHVAGYTVARPVGGDVPDRDLFAVVVLDVGHRFDAYDGGLHVAELVVHPDNLTRADLGYQTSRPEVLRPAAGTWWKAKSHLVATGPAPAFQGGDIIRVDQNNGGASEASVSFTWSDGGRGAHPWPLRRFADAFDGPYPTLDAAKDAV